MKRLFGLLLVLLFVMIRPVTSYSQTKAIIAYYAGSAQQLDSFDARGFTHLIYCFGHLQENRYALGGKNDTLLIQKMVTLKKRNPTLKVLLSLGGWGGCAPCSEGFSTEVGRSAFANSVRSLLDFIGADGIDLDWEYPAIEGVPGHRYTVEDRANFTELVRKLRTVLGNNRIISFAAGGFDKYLTQSIDWKAVSPQVDFINLMTYDLVNGYSTRTGHHTPLFSTEQQKESTDHCVNFLLDWGIAPEKLIIGAAFYARVWGEVESTNHGLYQSGRFKMGVSYRHLETHLSAKDGYTFFWDSIAQAPYAYNPVLKQYATFDNPRSIEAKCRYVLQNNLGGIMFWQLNDDRPHGGLLEVINKTLRP